MSNPIHYSPLDVVNAGNVEPKGWYFWDETWADRCGPYGSREEAEHMIDRYAREVLDGKAPDHDLNTCVWCGQRETLPAPGVHRKSILANVCNWLIQRRMRSASLPTN